MLHTKTQSHYRQWFQAKNIFRAESQVQFKSHYSSGFCSTKSFEGFIAYLAINISLAEGLGYKAAIYMLLLLKTDLSCELAYVGHAQQSRSDIGFRAMSLSLSGKFDCFVSISAIVFERIQMSS